MKCLCPTIYRLHGLLHRRRRRRIQHPQRQQRQHACQHDHGNPQDAQASPRPLPTHAVGALPALDARAHGVDAGAQDRRAIAPTADAYLECGEAVGDVARKGALGGVHAHGQVAQGGDGALEEGGALED
ncbi:hypothetical protein P8C59_004046 [Phyllachora maydis]|uniref:Uncharacterized protein n=1 Tax=Phyllachora maydis TaxID=1825666 RepID=A0AAD9MC19_9PEZI|nr:hypothetical protein P8C59_004046 [Phyllachora maydis]